MHRRRPLALHGALLASALSFALHGALSAQDVAHRTWSGEQVRENTEKVLRDIAWVNDLARVKELAVKNDKLIFWMQIVGELDGGL